MTSKSKTLAKPVLSPHLLQQSEGRTRIIELLRSEAELDVPKLRRLAAEDVVLELKLLSENGSPARNAVTTLETWTSVINDLLAIPAGGGEGDDGFDVLTQTHTQQLTQGGIGQQLTQTTTVQTTRRTARLTEKEISNIKALLKNGESQTQTAKLVGVSMGAVNKIAKTLT